MKKKNTNINTLAAGLFATATLIGSANAAISITQKVAPAYTDRTMSLSSFINVTSADSVVVVGFYVDGTAPALTNMTLGGATVDGVVTGGRTALAYFINPAVGALNLVDGDTGGNDNILGAWELAGVDLTAAPTSSATDSITTTTTDQFIISIAGVNGDTSVLSPTVSSVIDAPLDLAYTTLTDLGDPGGGAFAGGSAAAPTIGAYDTSWNNDAYRVSLAFTAAVPEPSTTALLGLGGLALILRRRK